MKTSLFKKNFLTICAMAAITAMASGQTTNSTFIGNSGDNWNNPNHWDPTGVPNNSGTHMFNVSIGAEDPGAVLDINPAVTSLTFTGDFATMTSYNHNFTSSATNGGGYFSILWFGADTTSSVANLGDVADFSDHTLNFGALFLDGTFAPAGVTTTVQFNGADIRTNNCDIGLYGPDTRIVDENGHDALANFKRNLVNGVIDIETGRNFTSAGSVVNEGIIYLQTTYGGVDLADTFTVSGDYTGIGYPLDPGTEGAVFELAAGPTTDAKLVINGALTNYDQNKKTLRKTHFEWEAAGGRSAITQVLGGKKPLDIVTNEGSLSLYGPNTGFRDKFGNDALRNLTDSARFIMSDRNFNTAGSFTSSSRLTIYGNSQFNVNGDLTITDGQFQVFAMTGYAVLGQEGQQDGYGFPTQQYAKSTVTVKDSLKLMSGTTFRYGIFDHATLPEVRIGDKAVLGGTLVPYLLDGANITPSDTFTLLTAEKISGQFSNVASGGRVTVTSFSNGSELGTFLVTYGKAPKKHDDKRDEEHGQKKEEALVLSDFQHN